MPETTATADLDQLRVALLELLTNGQHRDAAKPDTLTDIGEHRRWLRDTHHVHCPDGVELTTHHRFTTLAEAVGELARQLHEPDGPDSPRTELVRIAAIVLGWLDACPPLGWFDDQPPF